MRPIDLIVAHCSDTKDSPGVSWDDIERGHVLVKGWDDIGYHGGIEYVDRGIVCTVGRPLTLAGAHVRGHNENSLGFMFCGQFDEEPPAEELLVVAARRVLAPWCRIFGLGTGDIHPHRAYDSGKTCPGEAFDMGELRAAVREFL